MDHVGIFSKPIIDDKGDLFLLFSNPLYKKASQLACKEITADSNDDDDMLDEDLKFTMVSFPDNFKEVFQTPDKAILIDNNIFIKGVASKVLHAKIEKEDGQEVVRIANTLAGAYRLPIKASCVINEA